MHVNEQNQTKSKQIRSHHMKIDQDSIVWFSLQTIQGLARVSKGNSFEKLLSFNKALFCVVFLFVFELQWWITRKLFIIYWFRFQTRIWVILMILSFIAHIYPMKGLSFFVFFFCFFFFQQVRVNKFALI